MYALFLCIVQTVFLKLQLFSQTFYCILVKHFEMNRDVYETARAHIVKHCNKIHFYFVFNFIEQYI